MLRRAITEINTSRRPGRRLRRTGAVVVEAAVTLPILVLFVMGMIEFGRAMMVQQVITNAARDAARRASIDGATTAEVDLLARETAARALKIEAADLTADISVNGEQGTNIQDARPGDACAVTLTVPYSRVRLVPAKFLIDKPLQATATMHHE